MPRATMSRLQDFPRRTIVPERRSARSDACAMPEHTGRARCLAQGKIGPMPNPDRKLEIVADIPESAMVVFAHPDDAEIGSGGVIAKWVASGCDVSYVLCTDGGAGTADRSLTPGELTD